MERLRCDLGLGSSTTSFCPSIMYFRAASIHHLRRARAEQIPHFRMPCKVSTRTLQSAEFMVAQREVVMQEISRTVFCWCMPKCNTCTSYIQTIHYYDIN